MLFLHTRTVTLLAGKTVIVVKDVPGFYVNRALGPFMAEVSSLLADGADMQALDKALVQFGMPVGPITLADEVRWVLRGWSWWFIAEIWF